MPSGPDLRTALVLLVATLVGVALVGSPTARGRDPAEGLQQLDLLYLHQPAPLADRLDLPAGEPTLLVVCEGCEAPDVPVATITTNDPDVASAYALRRADGRVGPGYALIDSAGVLRYRTFDTGLAQHGQEIRILIEGLP